MQEGFLRNDPHQFRVRGVPRTVGRVPASGPEAPHWDYPLDGSYDKEGDDAKFVGLSHDRDEGRISLGPMAYGKCRRH